MINLRLYTMLLASCICTTLPMKLPLSSFGGNISTLMGEYPPIGPGTDSGLYNLNLFQGDILIVEQPEGRNAVADPNKLWPYATVIYKTDENLGCPYSPQCKMLMQAIDHFQRRTCIRFKEWTGESNYVRIFFNNQDTGSCWSQVGMVGKKQQLSLSQRCWYFGIVLHELSHSLGMFHEMNRPDRDKYITIYWDNIIPSYKSAFAKYDTLTDNLLGEPFDFNSVMLYDEFAFSKDNVSPTVVANDGRVIGPIWKKTKLSDVDVRRIKKLYTCDGTKTKPGFPYDVKCNFDKHICGFRNAGLSVWSWRNDKDGHLFNKYETVGTSTGYLVSTNMHPVTLDDPRGHLGCIRFWYIIQTDGAATLKLSQAYLNKTTSLKYNPDTIFYLWQNEETELNKWIHLDIPFFTISPFKLIFESQFSGNNTYGTIALDDIEIIYGKCETENIFNLERTLSSKSTTESGSTNAFVLPGDNTNEIDTSKITK